MWVCVGFQYGLGMWCDKIPKGGGSVNCGWGAGWPVGRHSLGLVGLGVSR
jgi:hypothetical protein